MIPSSASASASSAEAAAPHAIGPGYLADALGTSGDGDPDWTEALDEPEKAREHYEEVYIVDVTFRDISEKMKKFSTVS